MKIFIQHNSASGMEIYSLVKPRFWSQNKEFLIDNDTENRIKMETINPKQILTFEEIVNHRRSVRLYKDSPLEPEKVKHCLELATLAPNSSNMQLWEFYHITNPEILKKIAVACLNQKAATTARKMVVFVTRQAIMEGKRLQDKSIIR